jgi:hypothetical protein
LEHRAGYPLRLLLHRDTHEMLFVFAGFSPDRPDGIEETTP